MPVAVGPSGEPQNTGNIYDIGWLQASAKPGNGMTVLNGFTVGPTKPGALNGMTNLLVGDVIEIEKGDGTKASYKVVKTHNYPSDKVDMQAVKTAPDVSGRGLSIMANVGRFNVRTNQFEDRAVVWAVQL
jgi:hypothetical protein